MIKSFVLGAVDWSVEINNNRLDDREAYGTCHFGESKILIADEYQGKKRGSSSMDQTLYHEVIHAILFTMGKTELMYDEEFVQQLSTFIHQFEKTKK